MGGVDCSRACVDGVSSDVDVDRDGGVDCATGVSCGVGVTRDLEMVFDLGVACDFGAERGFGVACSPSSSSSTACDLLLVLALGVCGWATDVLLARELRDATLLRFCDEATLAAEEFASI